MINRKKLKSGDLVRVIGVPRNSYSHHPLSEFIQDNRDSDIGRVTCVDGDGKHIDVVGAVTDEDNWDWWPEDLEELSENEIMLFKYQFNR